MANKITIEETLQSIDVVTALTDSPYLIYSEVLEGARRPLVFLQIVKEIKDLVGAVGNRYQFVTATHLTASSDTEDDIVDSGMAASDKTLDAVDVSLTDAIWCAVQLSDFLKEDFPNFNFVQMHMQNMGKAVMEFLDALVYSTLAAASQTETSECDKLDYEALVDAITEAKDEDWIPDSANPPFLMISAGAAGELVKDATFVSTERYTTANVAKMVAGETGLIAGLKVMESSLLADLPYAYIVFPSDGLNGPVMALIWKRELKVTNIYVPQNGYTYFNTSIRAVPVVVQSKGIVKITIATTP